MQTLIHNYNIIKNSSYMIELQSSEFLQKLLRLIMIEAN